MGPPLQFWGGGAHAAGLVNRGRRELALLLYSR